MHSASQPMTSVGTLLWHDVKINACTIVKIAPAPRSMHTNEYVTVAANSGRCSVDNVDNTTRPRRPGLFLHLHSNTEYHPDYFPPKSQNQFMVGKENTVKSRDMKHLMVEYLRLSNWQAR